MSSSSSSKRDYYEVLGVPRGVSKADLKKSYLNLVKKHHPDRNPDDAEAKRKFQEITEAYEVLGDDEKRKVYDNYGHAGMAGMGGSPGGGGFGFGAGGGDPFAGFGGRRTVNPEDIFSAFEDIFGQAGFQSRAGPRGARRGQDLQVGVRLSFFDAVFGAKRKLSVAYRLPSTRGRQGERRSREVEIEIPPGVENGSVFQLFGKGAEGVLGGQDGDLFVQVQAEPDPYFRREGADIHVDAAVPLSTALLGGVVDVLTIDGLVEVKVPAGTSPDTQLLLRGKGVKMDTGGRGNMHVHLKIDMPTSLTHEQREILEKFREMEQEQPLEGPEGGSFSSKIRSTLEETLRRLAEHIPGMRQGQ